MKPKLNRNRIRNGTSCRRWTWNWTGTEAETENDPGIETESWDCRTSNENEAETEMQTDIFWNRNRTGTESETDPGVGDGAAEVEWSAGARSAHGSAKGYVGTCIPRVRSGQFFSSFFFIFIKFCSFFVFIFFRFLLFLIIFFFARFLPPFYFLFFLYFSFFFFLFFCFAGLNRCWAFSSCRVVCVLRVWEEKRVLAFVTGFRFVFFAFRTGLANDHTRRLRLGGWGVAICLCCFS